MTPNVQAICGVKRGDTGPLGSARKPWYGRRPVNAFKKTTLCSCNDQAEVGIQLLEVGDSAWSATPMERG